MLYKLYDNGFVNSLDDSVTDYQTNFLVKNPYGSAPITLRWGFNFTMAFRALLISGKSNSNASILGADYHLLGEVGEVGQYPK